MSLIDIFAIFIKGDKFRVPVLFPEQVPSKTGSPLKEKNMLLNITPISVEMILKKNLL